MFATEQDIVLLQQLQEADRVRELSEKEFEALPQRQAILEVREKLNGVYKKKTQVQDMLDDAEAKFDALVAEDTKLTEKQQEIEKTLTEVQGDYRSVESLTRDLHGSEKRRETLSKESEELTEQINKISEVMKQVMQVIAGLEAQEKEQVESFRAKGGSLKEAIEASKKTRDTLITQISPEVVKHYEDTVKRTGGVALAQLEGTHCSACRNEFDLNRMKGINEQAPLATCPYCSRLLIVAE